VDVAVQPHRTLPQLAENRVIVSTSPSIIQLLVKDVPDCLLQQKHSGKDILPCSLCGKLTILKDMQNHVDSGAHTSYSL